MSRSLWSGTQARSATVVHRSFKSEVDNNIGLKYDEKGTLSTDSSAAMVTIRAKLANSNLHNSLSKEKGKKRLTSRAQERECGLVGENNEM